MSPDRRPSRAPTPRPAPPVHPGVLAALLGGAAFLFYVPWMGTAFDGRARSLVLPQALWLGWVLLMTLSARLGARRTVGTFLGAAVMFYGSWGVTFLITSTYYARTTHG